MQYFEKTIIRHFFLVIFVNYVEPHPISHLLIGRVHNVNDSHRRFLEGSIRHNLFGVQDFNFFVVHPFSIDVVGP